MKSVYLFLVPTLLSGLCAAITYKTDTLVYQYVTDPIANRKLHRTKRAEEPLVTERHRKSLIRALDNYFGFNKRSAHPKDIYPMDSESGKNSRKKELIQGKVEMSMGMDKKPMKDMAVVLLPENNMFGNKESMNVKEEKMVEMVDKMLMKIMKNKGMMKAMGMEEMSKKMDDNKSDIVHGFEIPSMDELKNEESSMVLVNQLKQFMNEKESESSVKKMVIRKKSNIQQRVPNPPVSVSQDLNPELQFTTLEVDLGPAILPLEVPDGYFVPFIPRQAFGVTNGVARPPHGHSSFYIHRPAGLVDVQNSPAFGFLFSGQTRAPEISVEETTAGNK